MSKRFPGRRLSLLRLAVLIVVVGIIGTSGVFGFRWWHDETAAEHSTPWFAAYVDVTATPAYAFESPSGDEDRNVVLGFIVAAAEDDCTATWGAYDTPDEAEEDRDLDRRVARLRQADGNVVVSFGGQANTALAAACASPDALAEQYEKIVKRYEPVALDFDIEGDELADADSRARRAEAVAQLEQKFDRHLATWLTLPVGRDGLTRDGVAVVREFLDAGVHLDGVNAMTMNFGGAGAASDSALSTAKAEEQSELAIDSLQAVHRQLKALYADRGEPVGDQTAWRMVGATPMIGQNDVQGEVFTLADARRLSAFAQDVGLGRMSMWSANRDYSCAAAYTDLSVMSDSCSGVEQGQERFASILATSLTGSPAGDRTPPAPEESTVRPEELTDDPETSPYPVWNAEGTYPEDARVVWRRNVYASKWWNTGSQPDDPSVAPADSPWTLIWPVLPGEKPLEQLQLPDGFYPAWNPKTEYRKGERMMLDGIAYEAKWWTQGDDPASGQADPGASPWRALGQDEIGTLLEP